MNNVILTLEAFALAILVMLICAFLNKFLRPRPIKGMAVLAPMFVFLMVTRHTGLLENIGIQSEQVLYGVIACGVGMVFLDGFAGSVD